MIDQASRGASDHYRDFRAMMQLRGDPMPMIAVQCGETTLIMAPLAAALAMAMADSRMGAKAQ